MDSHLGPFCPVQTGPAVMRSLAASRRCVFFRAPQTRCPPKGHIIHTIALTILPIKKILKAQKTIGSLTSLEVPGQSIPLVLLMLDLAANSVL